MALNSRTPTAVDQLAEAYLDDFAALDPLFATEQGLAGHDAELPDLSPDGHAAISALRRRTLAALETTQPVDATDRVTVAALSDQLTVAEQVYAAGIDEAMLNVTASPVQYVRQVFDLMATSTADDWAVIATRLSRVPEAIDGYIASLRTAAARGDVSPRRQVVAGIEQCQENIGPDGLFAKLAAEAGDLPVRSDVDRGALAASGAYEKLAAFLADDLLPQARDTDPVGRERYALLSRSFLGSEIDLDETYAWGQEELARITAALEQTAERIKSGASVPEAREHLDADPGHMLRGKDALQAWMQEKADAAVAALAGTHFDIPEQIRTLACRIAPTASGGMYYTGPSEDFTRPGTMWWAIPDGVTEFSTWRELSVVYHEGVPGHHLQIAQTAYRHELLNRWRRKGSWLSGHGEGWALYAERLMADLGFLDDPGDLLGMLDSQSLRAARVVLDIGVHCGLEAPAEVGGGAWDYDKAWQFLTAHSSYSQPLLRFELNRYLGWPAQAPAYKVGERLWLALRDEARRREGDAFDLKAFHRRALDVGSMGLDVLRAAVLGDFDDQRVR